MGDVLLGISVLAFMIYGFRIMKKIDVFLENNRREIDEKHIWRD